jgi:hypothetical protein
MEILFSFYGDSWLVAHMEQRLVWIETVSFMWSSQRERDARVAKAVVPMLPSNFLWQMMYQES